MSNTPTLGNAGSTSDIPTIDQVDKSLERATSLSTTSLENGTIASIKDAEETTSTSCLVVDPETVSIKSAPHLTVDSPSSPSSHSFSSSTSSSSSTTTTNLPPSGTTPNCICTEHPTPTPPPSSRPSTYKPLSCELCNNYELQLQETQYREGVLSLQISAHEKTIKQLKEELKKEQRFRTDLEEKYNEEAKKTELETRGLSLKVDEGQKAVAKLTSKFTHFEKKSNDLVQELIAGVEALKKELTRVNHENEILLGKTLKRAQQLLSEDIDIPSAVDDLQLYVLKLREDLIQALAAKEHIEETLSAENLFLKEQLRGEHQSKAILEESFTQETDVLNSSLESKKMELADYKKRFSDAQRELEALKGNFNQLTVSSGARIAELEHQVEELVTYKTKAESDILQMKNKVSALQVDLENSEAVQRDFVKLSQSLQVQLEKIRQADTEVRWQHEDDATECSSCKKVFHSKKEKVNCKHCGRIFCGDCTAKVIPSGPKQRPCKVCNVCHTLLDNQTACWFVNEAPHSPT